MTAGTATSVGDGQPPVPDATSTGVSALRLRGVGRRFGGVQAVQDVDLDVSLGERRAILGPNGAGKTTLFNLIAGDFPPTTGTIEVLGTDVTTLPPRTRPALGLSRSYQKSRLFGGLTVLDNLTIALRGKHGGRLRWYRGRDYAGLLDRARHAADQVALGHAIDTPVASLSHGEQRQLEVAMAQVTDPQVIMLDEPASGLSRGERERLTELLLAIPREVTLVLIEHDMDVALNVAEYVTMMHDGKKIVEGTPAEIRANELVHDLYLGSGHYE